MSARATTTEDIIGLIVSYWHPPRRMRIPKEISKLINSYYDGELSRFYKIKVVLVGEHNTGKTSLCYTYTMNECPKGDDYIMHMRVMFTASQALMIEGKIVTLEIIDTSSNDNSSMGKHEHYDRERREICSDPSINIFLLCFSVIYDPEYHVDYKSREKEIMYRKDELTSLNPSVPIILCGTKIDTRNPPDEDKGRWTNYGDNQSWKSTAQFDGEFGKRMAKEIDAIDYIECSSLQNIGVKDAFNTVAKEALKNMGVLNDRNRSNSSGCCVLL